LFMGW